MNDNTPEKTPVPANALEILPAPSAAYVLRAEEQSLGFLNPKLWSAMQVAAQTFFQAGALPSSMNTTPKIVMCLQAGYEAGLKPLEALGSFYFVNGKLAMYGEKAIMLVQRAGHKIVWGKCDAETATITITRGDDPSATMTNTFTMAEAKKRGLTKNQAYEKSPENMLKFKAFHMTAKFVCPDAFSMPLKEIVETEYEPEKINPADVAPLKGMSQVAEKAPMSLEAALEAPVAPVESPKGKKKAVVVEEPAKDPEPEPEQTDDQKFGELVDRELRGEKLTGSEKMWMAKHHQKMADKPLK